MTRQVGPDSDPLNDKCDACGAKVAEDCNVGCIGKANRDDEDHVLGRTTGGSTLVRASDFVIGSVYRRIRT